MFKDNFDKKAACIDAVISFNKDLFFEMLAGILLLAIINYSYFKKTSQHPLRKTFLIELFFVIITSLTMAFFTLDYIDRNMAGL